MDQLKKALIIIDGTDMARKTAGAVMQAIGGEGPESWTVKIAGMRDFAGVDILGPGLIFLGAGAADSVRTDPAFAYFKKVLAHINLAGRRAAVFAANNAVAAALQELLADSEITVYPAALATQDALADGEKIKDWAKSAAAA
jgi:hypothetical protein